MFPQFRGIVRRQLVQHIFGRRRPRNRLGQHRAAWQSNAIPVEVLEDRTLLSGYEFTKLVDTDTVIPGRTESFNNFPGEFDLDRNTVIFHGENFDTNFEGLYYATPGGLTTYIDQDTPLPDDAERTWVDFGSVYLDGGTVGFAGRQPGFSSSHPFIGFGDQIVTIVESNTTEVPGGTGKFGSSFGRVVFGGGTIAFSAGNFNQSGIYTSNGSQLVKAVDSNDPLPGVSSDVQTSFGSNFDVDNHTVVFVDTDLGVYSANTGQVQIVADTNTDVPGSAGNFSFFFDSAVIDGQNVAFTARYVNENDQFRLGVFLKSNDEIIQIADYDTPKPEGGTFRDSFAARVAVSGNNVAFTTVGAIYVSIDGEIRKVIDRDDELDGKEISNVDFVRKGLDGTTLAFHVRFRDGSRGIYLATTDEFAVQPGTPVLSAPTGTTSDATPTFQWNRVSNADVYDLWVNNLTTRQDEVIRETDLSENAFTPGSSLPAGTYRAWVRAIGAGGEVGEWSSAVDFTVAANALGRPTLSSPTGTISDATPQIAWSAVSGADHYDLWVDNRTTGDKQVIRQQQIDGTSFTPESDLSSGIYRVWVRAVNSNGQAGDWSPLVDFTLAAQTLSQPTIEAPTGTVDDSTPTFRWSAVAGAARYDLWVNNRSLGTEQVIRQENITATSFTPTTDLADGEFRFWVRAIGSEGNEGPWSAAGNVTISSSDLAKPVWGSPTGDVRESRPTLSWEPVSGATGYDLWVRQRGSLNEEFIREKNLTGTSYTPLEDLPEAGFRVWVRAFNDSGQSSPWSDGVNFEVVGAKLEVDISDGPIKFSGYSTATAARYDLWINNSTTGEMQVIRKTDITTPEYSIETLPFGRYIAWVRPIDSVGEPGEWTNGVSFEIKFEAPRLYTPVVPATDRTPVIRWLTSFPASRYELWVDNRTTNQTQVISELNLFSTSYEPNSNLSPGDYRAWVRAYDADGNETPWSKLFDFTILDDA